VTASPPRALVSWLNPPGYIPPLRLSPLQVTTITDHGSEATRSTSDYVLTPRGEYDLSRIIQPIHPCNSFDLVLVQCDASGLNFPRNLAAFGCPRILLLCDTHHMKMPLRRLMAYARSEAFEFIIGPYDRHHLHWFVEAGFGNVAWIPGATLHHVPFPWLHQREPRLAMVGQLGKFHPRRARLVSLLQQQGLPIMAGTGSREVAAQLYAQSRISFNCSLNGDLNLRIFEILGAGGFLLTDRLSQESGLDLLLEDGTEYVSYGSCDELLDKVRFYLEHPKEALAIAEQGYIKFLRCHLPERKLKVIRDWLAGNALDPVYEARRDQRTVMGTDPRVTLEQRMAIYEAIQDVHLHKENVTILIHPQAPFQIARDVSDLPRAQIFVLDFPESSAHDPLRTARPDLAQVALPRATSTAWDFVIWPASRIEELSSHQISAASRLVV